MEERIKTIIIDDSKVDIQQLTEHKSGLEGFDIIGEFQDPAKAYNFLNNRQVDLVFTDIKMGQHNGLNLASSLPDSTKVVLMSSYAEYAIHGFELDVVDYLRKPITLSRLMKTHQKVKSRLKAEVGQTASIPSEDASFL